VEQQKKLENQARSSSRSELPRLAGEEKQLEQALGEFQEQHPKVFERTQKESEQAKQAMTQAAESLQKRSNEARSDTQKARQELEKLNQAMKDRSTERQLADAYKLKKMLDQQIHTCSKCSNPGSGVSDAEMQQTANEARDTVGQLKNIAEQEPTREAFGQPLRDALSGQNKVDLDARLSRLQQAQSEEEKQQRAGEAKEALSKVSQAFTESQPKVTQMARETDSLKPDKQESLSQGLAKLDSLLKQLQREHPMSKENQGKQGKEALFNLQTGLRSQYGDNERGNQILLHLEKMLKAEAPLEVADLKKLMDELQHFSVETSDRLARKDDKPDITNIDPSRLPPAYRGRIQKYFQKLSEKAVMRSGGGGWRKIAKWTNDECQATKEVRSSKAEIEGNPNPKSGIEHGFGIDPIADGIAATRI
jgi:hypothetical protein